MSLRLPIDPGAVLYDPHRDKIVVYSGHIVEDDFGQPAMFCHDRPGDENAASSKGVIYTGWLAKKYLIKIGEL
jgi:hypothetical protein